MPKKQQSTRIVSTVKTIWRRRETGKKTTAAWAAAHPAAVYKDYENVQRKERYS